MIKCLSGSLFQALPFLQMDHKAYRGQVYEATSYPPSALLFCGDDVQTLFKGIGLKIITRTYVLKSYILRRFYPKQIRKVRKERFILSRKYNEKYDTKLDIFNNYQRQHLSEEGEEKAEEMVRVLLNHLFLTRRKHLTYS